MERVLVIGIPGSGKSTLSKRLGAILNLPVIHLDQRFWNSGWIPTPTEQHRRDFADLASGDKWIMDGTYDSSLDLRLPRADTVIFLDFLTLPCFWRILKRIVTSYGTTRSDMSEGCPAPIDFPFFKYILQYRRKIRPNLFTLIETYFEGDTVIILKSLREVDKFLKSL
jgi:adenylate kinase family enzyme